MDSHNFSSETSSIFVIKEVSVEDQMKDSFEICNDAIIHVDDNIELRQDESNVSINVKNGSSTSDHNLDNPDSVVDRYDIKSEGCAPKDNISGVLTDEVISVTAGDDGIIYDIKEELLSNGEYDDNDSLVSDPLNDTTQDSTDKITFPVMSDAVQVADERILNIHKESEISTNKSDSVKKNLKPISITSVKSLKITKNKINHLKNMSDLMDCDDEAQSSFNQNNKRSKVWKYFKGINDKEAQCNLCLKMFHGASSSNFRRHLRCRHANEPTVAADFISSLKSKKSSNVSSHKLKNRNPLVTSRLKAKKIKRIWKYYTRSKCGIVKCNVCFRLIPYHNSNSFLFRHLRLQHVHIYKNFLRSLRKLSLSCNNTNKVSRRTDGSGQKPSTATNVTSYQTFGKVRKSSETWKYFTKLSSCEIMCIVCNTVLKYVDGVSSNLTRHLRRKHPNIYSKNNSGYKRSLIGFDESVNELAATPRSDRIENDEIETEICKQEITFNSNDDAGVTKIRKYFTKSGEGTVICNLCHLSLSHTRGSTFNLKCHIIQKHKCAFDKIVEAIHREENKIFKTDSERKKEYEKIKLNWKYFMKMKSGKLKCNLCSESDVFYCEASDTLQHLYLKHNIDFDDNEEPSIPAIEFVDVEMLGNDKLSSSGAKNSARESLKNFDVLRDKKSNEIVVTDRTWKYFTKIFRDKVIEVKCTLCDHIFSYKHGVTSELTYHLNSVHKDNKVEGSCKNFNAVVKLEAIDFPARKNDNVNVLESLPKGETKIGKFNVSKTSRTWKYYTLVRQNKAQCIICLNELTFTHRSNSNLTRHLKRKHSNVIDLNTTSEVSFSDLSIDHDLKQSQGITEGEIQSDFKTIQDYFHHDKKLKSFVNFQSDCVKCKICSKAFMCSSDDINMTINSFQMHMQICHAEWQVVCRVNNSTQKDSDSSNYNELEAIANEIQSYITNTDEPLILNDDESVKSTQGNEDNPLNENYKNMWKYFTKLTSVNVRCNFCSLLLSYKNNKKWNLYRHLRLKHKSKLKEGNVIPVLVDNTETIKTDSGSDVKKKISITKTKQHSPEIKIEKCDQMEDVCSEVSDTRSCKSEGSSGHSSESDEYYLYTPEKSKRISRIGRTWSHFTKVEMGKAICNFCRKSIRYRGTGLDVLNKHLNKYHVDNPSGYPNKESKILGKSGSDDELSSASDDNVSDDENGNDRTSSMTEKEGEHLTEKRSELPAEVTGLSKKSSQKRKASKNSNKDKLSVKRVGRSNLNKNDSPEKFLQPEDVSIDSSIVNTKNKVWTYFTKSGNGFAKCHLCLAIVAYKGKVENLIRHLCTIHSVVSLTNQNRECVIEDEEENGKSQPLSPIDTGTDKSPQSNNRVCFTKLESGAAKCKFCSKIIMRRDGNVNRLTDHLRRFHKAEVNHDISLKNIKLLESDNDISISGADLESGAENLLIPDDEQNDLPNKKRSDTWLYYSRINRDHAQCNICNNVLSYKGGSVFNLTRHLSTKHDIKLLKHTPYKKKPHSREVKMMPKIFNICKKKSSTLSFYTKINRYVVKCKLCSKRFIYKGVNINRLVNHLWSSHITRLIEFSGGRAVTGSDHTIDSSNKSKTDSFPSSTADCSGNSEAETIFESGSSNIKKCEKRRKISSTWNYFTKRSDEDSKAKCNVCLRYFSYKNGNISNLSRHLLRYHGIKLVKGRPKIEERIGTKRLKDSVKNEDEIPKQQNSSLAKILFNNFGSRKERKNPVNVPFTDMGNKENMRNYEMLLKTGEDEILKSFQKVNISEVECNECKEKLAFEEGKIQNLCDHLLLKHEINIPAYSRPQSVTASTIDELLVAESFGQIKNKALLNSSVTTKKKKPERRVCRIKCKLCYRTLIFKGNKTDKLVEHINIHQKELSADENILLQEYLNSRLNCDKNNIDVSNSESNGNLQFDISKTVLYKYFKNLNLLKNKCKICSKFISTTVHCSHSITGDLSVTYGMKKNKLQTLDKKSIGNSKELDHESSVGRIRKRLKSTYVDNVNHFLNFYSTENKCGSCDVVLKNKGYCCHSLSHWLNENQQEKSQSECNDQVKIEDELEIITDALTDGENKIIIITDDGASSILNYGDSNKNVNESDDVSYVIGVDSENNDDIQVIIYNFDPEEGCEISDQQVSSSNVEEGSENLNRSIQPCNKELEEQVKVILQELNNANVYSTQVEHKSKASTKSDELFTDNQPTEEVFVQNKQQNGSVGHDEKQELEKSIKMKDSSTFSASVISKSCDDDDNYRNEGRCGNPPNVDPTPDSENSFEPSQESTCSSEASIKNDIQPMVNECSNIYEQIEQPCVKLTENQENIAQSSEAIKSLGTVDSEVSSFPDTEPAQDINKIELKEITEVDTGKLSVATKIDENNGEVYEESFLNLMKSMDEFNYIDPDTNKSNFSIKSGMLLQKINGIHKINKNVINFSKINYECQTAKCSSCKKYLLFERQGQVVYNLFAHLYSKHKNLVTMNNTLLDLTCDKNGEKILDLFNCNDDNVSNQVKPRRKSPVWKYFENNTNFRATCKICQFNFSYKGGAVNNLARHLRLRHSIHVSSKNTSYDNFETFNEDEIDNMKSYLVLPKKRAAVKLRSKTWNYFSKEPNDWAKCILCKRYLSYRSSTINNLTRHLRTVHSNIYNSLFLEKTGVISSDDLSVKSESLSDEIQKTLMLETTSAKSRDEVLQECSYASSERIGTKRKSVVWNYFTEVCRDSGRCNFCLKMISCKGGGTSNLSRHLRVKHGIWIVLTSTLTEQYEEQFLNSTDSCKGVSVPNQSSDASDMPNDTIITHEQLHILKNKRSVCKKSKTWDFFIKETPERVVCKICSKALSYKCKAVHNLRRHLAIKHPNHITKREPVRLKLQINNENENVSYEGQSESVDDNKTYIDITDTSVVIVDEENPPPTRKPDRSSRPKKSFVWNYFIEIEYGIAKCNMCYKVLSFRGGGTNNLMRHLRSRHSILIDLQLDSAGVVPTTAEVKPAVPVPVVETQEINPVSELQNVLVVAENQV